MPLCQPWLWMHWSGDGRLFHGVVSVQKLGFVGTLMEVPGYQLPHIRFYTLLFNISNFLYHIYGGCEGRESPAE